MSATLNLTEILSALQDEITVGGAISAEHRSFYTTFRAQLNTYSGSFIPLDIQRLMEVARNEASGDISDDEFEQFTKAVLSKISTKELLEIETEEQAEIRSAEQAAKDAAKEAEEAARKAEENARARIRKDEHEKTLAEIEAAKVAAIEETARIKAETAAQIQETKEAAKRATAEATARVAEESARKQAEAELEEAKRQAEAEIEEAKRQAEAEIEEAKRQTEIERLKLESLTAQEPEPDAEPLSEIDDPSKKIVPDIPSDDEEVTLMTPVEEDSNNVSRLLMVTGLIAAIGLAVAFLL